eukprot:s241_g22.t1
MFFAELLKHWQRRALMHSDQIWEELPEEVSQPLPKAATARRAKMLDVLLLLTFFRPRTCGGGSTGGCAALCDLDSLQDEAWHRIKDDYAQSGLLAALLLSAIGPFAVQIPQVMTDVDDCRSHAYVTLMGAAALLTL